MKILDSLEESHRDSLKYKTMLICTHATNATCQFLKTISRMGCKSYYVPVEYSKNDKNIEQISEIKNLEIINIHGIQKLLYKIDIIIEDGMRISELIHKNSEKFDLKPSVYSIEQTTSGIRRFEQIDLKYPVINVAESELKLGVENHIGTAESILTTLISMERISLAHKNILVIGYGKLGSGIARLCSEHGGNVMVVDADDVKILLARSNGFAACNSQYIDKVLKLQDIIISCTSNVNGNMLGVEQFLLMKNNVVVVNAGSGRGEIDVKMLTTETIEKHDAKIKITSKNDNLNCVFSKMGLTKHATILSNGHPINLRKNGGTSPEIMDFVFSLIVMLAIKINAQNLTANIHPVPKIIQQEISKRSELTRHAISPSLTLKKELRNEDRPWGKLSRFGIGSDSLNNFSVVRASFNQNTNTRGHYHAVSEEAYIVESGSADIITWNPKNVDQKKTFSVESGDYLSIPSGYVHKVIVTSKIGFSCIVVASPPFSFWDQFFPST